MMHAEQQKLFAEITVFSQAFGKFPAMASIHPCASTALDLNPSTTLGNTCRANPLDYTAIMEVVAAAYSAIME
jgi:hypothetical protein